uniref:uS12 prolyl 3-hydroxylase n=1 Tax=Cacopsylla melanoneura TaxID=428564 RepID=A0A8D8T6C3_9HEMI
MEEADSDSVFILDSECKMKVLSHPFEYIKFKNVFIPGFAKQLKEDVLQLDWSLTCSDLFSFLQTRNFINIKRKTPTIQLFVEALLGNIGDMLSDHYNIEFNKKVTVSGSVYRKGDFLLCHDDASDDRAVAFILYLTEEPWLKTWGGTLDLFQTIDSQVTHGKKSIVPSFNSLICFKVDPNVTYHQVSEVTANVDRVSVNGWFHSDMFKHEPKLYLEPKVSLCKNIKFYSIGGHSYLTEFINHKFFYKDWISKKQKEFVVSNMLAAGDFFRSCTMHVLIEELENKTLWKMQGPPYKRKYDVASITTLPTTLRTLVHFMTSLEWFNYFEAITSLNKADILSSSFEIQRWLAGYYTLLYYTNDLDEEPIDIIDVFVYINMNNVQSNSRASAIVYSIQSLNEFEDDAFELQLVHNHIYLIHRKSHSSWFIKYLKKHVKNKFYLFQMSYSLSGQSLLRLKNR